MRLLWTLCMTMFVGLSHAQDFEDLPEEEDDEVELGEATVFVSPFVAKNQEAAGLAGIMPSFLESELDQHPDLRVIRIDEVPPVHNMDAYDYLESCPPGQIVGCAFVVAENGGADFALAGTVRALPTGTRAEIVIIDVAASREVLGFQVDLGAGDDERFAEGVAGVLVAVVKGEAGRLEDIRDQGDGRGADYSAAVAQLSQLSNELGDVSSMEVRQSAKIERPQVTTEDITARMETEGVKPWERLGMGPDEYLRFRNSGLNLEDWRVRFSGRQMQLILRPSVGYGRGPTHGKYYGSYARGGEAADTLSVQEVYAWQSQLSGGGMHASISAGFGLTPILEIGATEGYAGGRYGIEVQSKTINNTAAPTRPQEHANPNAFVGSYLLAGLMPGSTIRPVLGLGVLYWMASGVETKEQLPDVLPRFSAPRFVMIEGKAGAEARLSKHVDVFLHVPVTAVVAGNDTEIRHQGKSCQEDDGSECLRTSMTPPGLSPMGAGVMVGLQVRLFGRKHDDTRFRNYDAGDEELD